jgi:hypothetical protein
MELLSSRIPNRADRTHIENVKDPEKFLIPSGNFVLISLRENEPDNCAPFAPPIDLPLHLGHGSATNHHR